ncbi:hypothetical protein BC835DRAFT_540082 [Cytidiella melzeri]|nr:hypothetical protein BC835DRAFT_540082 [Cytidiella melzeri]
MQSAENAKEHTSLAQSSDGCISANDDQPVALPVILPDPSPPQRQNSSTPFCGVHSQSTGTRCLATATSAHDVEAKKIQDYKEDINIIAGLSSIVMTAFLAKSYEGLTSDPNDIVIMLLEQVAFQTHSYVISAGFLNSTAPPLFNALPVFQPPVNAIRINVLWTASLTLSLISASFGILVKHWLREYLVGNYYASSQVYHLRVRHSRKSSLEDWKMYEIAGVLPLLIQFSLALFLIGLCFFTAEVHSSVGHTTLPLVAGWGFLFLAASFLPALSPRCPYKTPILSSAIAELRKMISGVVGSAR